MLRRCDHRDFFVVVPMFNEERGVSATLRALAAQSDTAFTLILVDNGSTDASVHVASECARSLSGLRLHLIHEPQKGTGAASDTGFRYAIALGARWIARTDADCIPRSDWIANIKGAMVQDGLEFVAGKIRPREDEEPLSGADRAIIATMIWVAEHYGKIHRRGRRFKYPYIMVAGNNLAVTAELYERSGGFPRTAIEDAHEDRILSESVRTLTDRAALRSDVVVFNSARRVRAYGYLNTLRWYRNHGYRPDVVDVR